MSEPLVTQETIAPAVAAPDGAATAVAYPVPARTAEAIAGPILSQPPAPTLGLVIDPQNRVMDVVAGGAADRAGVHVGDTLVRIDALPFGQERDAIKAYINYKDVGAEMLLTYTRNATEQQVKILSAVTPLAAPGKYVGTPTPPPRDYYYL